LLFDSFLIGKERVTALSDSEERLKSSDLMNEPTLTVLVDISMAVEDAMSTLVDAPRYATKVSV
jgi:hypothetical protein